MPKGTPCLWEKLKKESRPIVIYGMGNGADKLIAELDAAGIPYADIFASDGFVRGQSFHGRTVLSFGDIQRKYKDFVILLAFGTSRSEVLYMIYEMADRYPLFMPDLPVAGNTVWNTSFEHEYTEELLAARSIFADEESLHLFDAVCAYRHSGDITFLRQAPVGADTPLSFIPYRTIVTAVDAGAYRGETVASLKDSCPNLIACVAIEPDRRNYAKLLNYKEKEKRLTVYPLHAAAWDKTGRAAFHGSGNRNASLVGHSHQFAKEEVDTLALDCLLGGKDAEEVNLDTSVLSVLHDFRAQATGKVDYIKYDVEGAEAEALLGSSNLIADSRPILAVSVYHRTEDLFRLPLLVQKLCPEYDFYLVRKECLPAWDLMLYAVPKERQIKERSTCRA